MNLHGGRIVVNFYLHPEKLVFELLKNTISNVGVKGFTVS